MDSIELTLDFSQNSMDDETLEILTQTLYQQLYELDEAESVNRNREIADPQLKGAGKLKPGWVSVVFDPKKISQIWSALIARLGGKGVAMTIKHADGKTIKIECKNIEKDELKKLIAIMNE